MQLNQEISPTIRVPSWQDLCPDLKEINLLVNSLTFVQWDLFISWDNSLIYFVTETECVLKVECALYKYSSLVTKYFHQ